MLLKNYRMPYLDKPQNHMIHACVSDDCFKLGMQICFLMNLMSVQLS